MKEYVRGSAVRKHKVLVQVPQRISVQVDVGTLRPLGASICWHTLRIVCTHFETLRLDDVSSSILRVFEKLNEEAKQSRCVVLPVSPRARGSFVSLAKFKEPQGGKFDQGA